MTKQEFRNLLQTMADGWNGGDAAKAAGAFAENVRYGDPTRYAFGSRPELYEFFGGAQPEPQSCVWHHILFDEEEQLGAGEYTYEGSHRYHGFVLIKVEGGKVTHWREYQHVSPTDWEDFVKDTF